MATKLIPGNDAVSVAPNGDVTFKGSVLLNGIVRLKSYTVATLPTGTQGDFSFVTDALLPAFLATVAGGGAVVSPVFIMGPTG